MATGKAKTDKDDRRRKGKRSWNVKRERMDENNLQAEEDRRYEER